MLNRILLLVAAAGFAACARENPPAAAKVRPGSTWASIAELPDFSGGWTQPADNALGKALFEDCCVPGKGKAPFTPKFQRIRDQVAKNVDSGASGKDNLIQCLPDGMPGILLHGLVFQFLFTPDNITMLIENGEVRRIFTDGRPHPPLVELYNSVEGHSIGHWAGKTLVVDTIGMRGDAMLFYTGGMTVSRNTHLIERMWLEGKDTLMIETTVEDPEIFAKPYVYRINFVRGLREDDFVVGCSQDNRDTEGRIDLTPPPA
jgi:hypothetical protein